MITCLKCKYLGPPTHGQCFWCYKHSIRVVSITILGCKEGERERGDGK
jgi:hypothetical protein